VPKPFKLSHFLHSIIEEKNPPTYVGVKEASTLVFFRLRKPFDTQEAGAATFNAGAYPVDSVRIPFNALFQPDWNDLTAAQGTRPFAGLPLNPSGWVG